MITPVVNFCWGFFKWGIALALAATIALGGYFYWHLDEEVCSLASQALAKFYPELITSVGGSRYSPGQGLTMRDVVIALPGDSAERPMLHIEQLTLTGRLDPQSLLMGQALVEQIHVVRPTIYLARDAAGAWNVAQLYHPPKARRKFPEILLTGGTGIYTEQEAEVSLGPWNARVESRVTDAGSLELAITGEQIGEFLRGGRLALGLVLPEKAVNAEVHFPKTEVTEQLLSTLPRVKDILPPEVQVRFTLGGVVQVSRAVGAEEFNWRVQAQVTRGEAQHPRWPRGVSQVSCGVVATPAGCEVTNFQGRSGVTTIAGSAERNGWQSSAPLKVAVDLKRAALDEELFLALPGSAQQVWRRLQPRGEFDLAGSAAFDGQRWSSDQATLHCRDIGLADAHRPQLQVTNLSGPVRLFQHAALGPSMDVQLTATAFGQPITIAAELHDFFPAPGAGELTPLVQRPLGWVELGCATLPLSPELLSLPPDEKARQLLAELRPRGEVGASARIEFPNRGEVMPQVAMAFELHGISLQYEKFPYPLTNLTGRISAVNDVWTISDMVASPPGSNRVVRGKGSIEPTPQGRRFRLALQSVEAPLDEHLYNSLPPMVQLAWRQIQPRGDIDFTAEVEHFAGQPRPAVRLTVVPHERRMTVNPTINETGYRIPLTEVDGRFDWNNGVLAFTNARALQGRARVSANGGWAPLPGGGWQITLADAYADRLQPTHELLAAMPLGLRRVIEQMQARGTFGVHGGEIVVSDTAPGAAPKSATWRLALDCQQAEMNWGVPIRGMTGVINLAGRTDGVNCVSAGELDLRSVIWNNLQFTNVRGPLWSDKDKCLLGRGVAAMQPSEAREVTAEAYGGRVKLSARVLLQQQGMFGLSAAIDDVDLARFAREGLGQQQLATGRLDGALQLNGQGAALSSLDGAGSFDIQQANFYELPILISLLKVLRNRAPDTNAFDRCQGQFRLANSTVNFEQLNFSGDAVSLNGAGELGFDRRVDLVFHTILGRHDNTIPSIRNLLGQASEQFWRLKVSGTIDNPDIQREALPMVNNMLGTLQQTNPVK